MQEKTHKNEKTKSYISVKTLPTVNVSSAIKLQLFGCQRVKRKKCKHLYLYMLLQLSEHKEKSVES